MATATEAPNEEPRTVSRERSAVAITGLGHRFGELEVLAGLELEVGATRAGRRRRAVRLRQVDPARAGRRPARADSRARSRSTARRPPRPGSPAASTCLSATCCCPGCRAIDNAALAPRNRGASRADARARGGAAVRALRARRLRARASGRAVRRNAPAGRVPAHAAGPQAGAAAGRAVRFARRDLPRRDAGVARRGAGRRARARRCSSPTTSRRRSTCATGSWS